MKLTARMTTLLRSVPTAVTVVFCLAVIVMNFLSRVTLISLPWLALNAGILVSWVAFLFMDVITKHYGAWAGNLLSILAICANLLCCLVCFAISQIWRHPALDMILGGQWSILLASTIAYVISALTNNYTNIFIGRRFTANIPGAFPVQWTVPQCVGASVLCAVFELLTEVVFAPLGYHISRRWKQQGVGEEYLSRYCPNGALGA